MNHFHINKIQINDNRLPYYHRSKGVTQFYLFNENTNNYYFIQMF